MSEVTFGGNTIGDKALYLNGVERGKKQERERIIKLLTTKEFGCPCGCRHWMNAEPVIALIKGKEENK